MYNVNPPPPRNSVLHLTPGFHFVHFVQLARLKAYNTSLHVSEKITISMSDVDFQSRIEATGFRYLQHYTPQNIQVKPS